VSPLSLIGFREAVSTHNGIIGPSGITVLSPTTVVPSSDAGVFYPVTPDISIVQVMFMGGLALAVLGVLGLSPRTGGPGWPWAGRHWVGRNSALNAAGGLQVAYGVKPLLDRGIDGRGETVVLPELAESQLHPPLVTDLRPDMAAFDERFQLPAARMRVVTTLAGAGSPD
jgi:hypothetical protein